MTRNKGSESFDFMEDFGFQREIERSTAEIVIHNPITENDRSRQNIGGRQGRFRK